MGLGLGAARWAAQAAPTLHACCRARAVCKLAGFSSSSHLHGPRPVITASRPCHNLPATSLLLSHHWHPQGPGWRLKWTRGHDQNSPWVAATAAWQMPRQQCWWATLEATTGWALLPWPAGLAAPASPAPWMAPRPAGLRCSSSTPSRCGRVHAGCKQPLQAILAALACPHLQPAAGKREVY